jgi:HD-like signal output (HDOD) protein
MTDTATTKSRTSTSSLREWIESLDNRDLPVLDNTIQGLCSTTADHDASASDLARVVLGDASLTSDVIRTANSAYYNPGGQTISTVSRGVVLLGFETVRSIGLSLAVIDTLVRGATRERVHRVFAESIHAAIQARLIAEHTGDPSPEEVFIASLLFRVGELAFWCFADNDTAHALEAALQAGEGSELAIQRETIGFSLRELSRELAREWRLGELLSDALAPGRSRNPRSGAARSAHRVVEHLAASQRAEAIAELRDAAHCGDEAAEELLRKADEALPELANALGVQLERHSGAEAASATPREEPAAVREPAPMLQLRVLREMSATVRESSDLQPLFDLTAEGVYRGLALDRCVVAVLGRDRRSLRVRSAIGDGGALRALVEKLTLDTPACRGLLRTIADGSVTWGGREENAAASPALPVEAQTELGPEWLLGPIKAAGRPVGLILADRYPDSRPVDREVFDGFCHFVEQTAMCIGHLAGR